MKKKRRQNIVKIPNSLISYALLMCFTLFSLQGAYSQREKTYDEIERTQDQIEAKYVEVYGIMDQYPTSTYSYSYDDNGVVTSVLIEGVSVKEDKDRLGTYLVDLERLKTDIANLSNRLGVYYVSETKPEPKDGYRDFYTDLHSNLTYPELAEDRGLEGTVYVKFVVDDDGEIITAVAS